MPASHYRSNVLRGTSENGREQKKDGLHPENGEVPVTLMESVRGRDNREIDWEILSWIQRRLANVPVYRHGSKINEGVRSINYRI